MASECARSQRSDGGPSLPGVTRPGSRLQCLHLTSPALVPLCHRRYTAPTDEALAYDVQAVPMFGLNMIRLHQKVNPERW